MKPFPLRQLCLAFAAGGTLLSAVPVHAFSYDSRDLLLVFRKSGSPDLEINLGNFSTFTTPGLSFTISDYNSTQFQRAFGSSSAGWVGLSFSVFSAVPVGNGDATYPNNTLLLSSPRTDNNTQTTPWTRQTSSSQGTTRSKILGIAGEGSATGAEGWSAGTPTDSVTNSAKVVIIPSADQSAYTTIAGTVGTLGNTTPDGGSVENTLNSAGATLRSDLYVVKPSSSSGSAEYVGYFQFDGNTGGVTYNPVPEPSVIASLALGGIALTAVLRRKRS